MTNQEILAKLNSVALFLSAHPDNDSDSEMNDRLNDICNVIEFLKPQKIGSTDEPQSLGSTDKKQGFSGFKDINGKDIYFDDYVYLVTPNGVQKREKFSVRDNFELWSLRSGRVLSMHDLHAKGYEFIITKP